MRKGVLGLVMVLVMLAGTAEAVPLPPAGDDLFPSAQATMEVESFNENGDIIQSFLLDCSGPTTIRRSAPNESQGTIPTEMVAMDLSCSEGVTVRLQPSTQTQRSLGQIQRQSQTEGDRINSFFDVFIEVTTDSGKLHNQQPVIANATFVHIPSFGSCYFGVQPVDLFRVDNPSNPAGTLTFRKLCLNGPIKPETVGEVSPVFSCFYECKQNSANTSWLELTTLMLVNPSRNSLTAQLVFFDGNERPIARSSTNLSPQDLDEINVCDTLNQKNQAGQPVIAAVPPAGVIEVVLTFPGTSFPLGGAYGWVKNITGTFKKTVAEPFPLGKIGGGTVTGIAKTECRLVGSNVITPQEIQQILNSPSTTLPTVNPTLIERTRE